MLWAAIWLLWSIRAWRRKSLRTLVENHQRPALRLRLKFWAIYSSGWRVRPFRGQKVLAVKRLTWRGLGALEHGEGRRRRNQHKILMRKSGETHGRFTTTGRSDRRLEPARCRSTG